PLVTADHWRKSRRLGIAHAPRKDGSKLGIHHSVSKRLAATRWPRSSLASRQPRGHAHELHSRAPQARSPILVRDARHLGFSRRSPVPAPFPGGGESRTPHSPPLRDLLPSVPKHPA